MLWFMFSRILLMSVSATCGGILIFEVSKIFKKRFSVNFLYYLWLLPLLAAFVPFSIST